MPAAGSPPGEEGACFAVPLFHSFTAKDKQRYWALTSESISTCKSLALTFSNWQRKCLHNSTANYKSINNNCNSGVRMHTAVRNSAGQLRNPKFKPLSCQVRWWGGMPDLSVQKIEPRCSVWKFSQGKFQKACRGESQHCARPFPPQHRNHTCAALRLPARALHQVEHMETSGGEDLSEPPCYAPR